MAIADGNIDSCEQQVSKNVHRFMDFKLAMGGSYLVAWCCAIRASWTYKG